MRSIAVTIICEKWDLDKEMVDTIIGAIEKSTDEHLLWKLYFLLGRNVDAGNCKKILVYLLNELSEKAVSK